MQRPDGTEGDPNQVVFNLTQKAMQPKPSAVMAHPYNIHTPSSVYNPR